MKPKTLIENGEKFVKYIVDEYEPRLLSADRNEGVTDARHVVAYILTNLMNLTTVEAGKLLNRDHSTIIHSRGLMVDALYYKDLEGRRLMAYNDIIALYNDFKNMSIGGDIIKYFRDGELINEIVLTGKPCNPIIIEYDTIITNSKEIKHLSERLTND